MESRIGSPWSNTEKKTVWAPEVIGVVARSSGVAPSYVVPAASAAENPAVLMLITLPAWSKAKLCGATTALFCAASAVKSEVSSSATKPSFTEPPTNSGNSSEKNRKSTARQLTPCGTWRYVVSLTMSKNELPWLPPPPPWSWVVPPLVFGSSANVVSPELMTA